jgi:uncharacterized protein
MKKCIWLSLLAAYILWYVMFVLRPLNFWLMMSASTLLLSGITLTCGSLHKTDWQLTTRDLFIGIGSSLALYGVFFIGNELLQLVQDMVPMNRGENIAAVYANRGALPPALVAALLCFPIGFGEELFWRGFVQKHFSAPSPVRGLIITTLLYTAVHLATGNPVLLLAALVCGVFWGGLYALTGSLPAVLISHMLWDPLIFVFFPVS